MDSKIKITSLIDNSTYVPGLKAEHGLSLFIETEKEKILFDCGQSDLLLKNAEKSGIDLKETDKIVISHGHYDHTGGLMDVLKYIGKETKVCCSPKIFENKMAGTKKGEEIQGFRFVGVSCKKKEFEEYGAIFNFIEQPCEISDDVFLSGAVKKIFFNPEEKSHFFIKKDGFALIDEMSDEISLYCFKEGINLIITGCAHRGIVNIMLHSEEIIEKIIFKDKYKADKKNRHLFQKFIIGGFHLIGENDKYLEKVIKEFQKFQIKKIVPMHCTGFNAACLFKNAYKDKFEYGRAGLVIEI